MGSLSIAKQWCYITKSRTLNIRIDGSDMRIAIAGIGYVGLSLAVLLSRQHIVIAYDVDKLKVHQVNLKKSTVADDEISAALSSDQLNLSATDDYFAAFRDAHVVIIATPTDYNEETHYFDTGSVEKVITLVTECNPSCLIVIKSTIPVGFTEELRTKYNTKRIIFSPEFLREGRALHDNLKPSRIIVGDKSKNGRIISNLLREAGENRDVPILLTDSAEAEAIKLFSNTYLAMRIAYFNELDSYAMANNMDSMEIIKGVGHDPRIGNFYNNPSFGYGGYCLPKDTKQLLANYNHVPNTLIKAIVDSNETRKDFIANTIIKMKPRVVGIHRLTMKVNSDNFRTSAVLGIMERIAAKEIPIIIFEPGITAGQFYGHELVEDLNDFKARSCVIMANREHRELSDVSEKVYTRDLFGVD